MLLRHSLGLGAEADAVERAIERALSDGCRTADLVSPGGAALSCAAMTGAIVDRVR
jgi:3-isopropylmalate dehydrogenase